MDWGEDHCSEASCGPSRCQILLRRPDVLAWKQLYRYTAGCHQLLVSYFVVQLPVSCHVVQLPVSCHVVQLPVSCHVVQLPVSCHVVQLPVSCHVVQLPVSRHVVQLARMQYRNKGYIRESSSQSVSTLIFKLMQWRWNCLLDPVNIHLPDIFEKFVRKDKTLGGASILAFLFGEIPWVWVLFIGCFVPCCSSRCRL